MTSTTDNTASTNEDDEVRDGAWELPELVAGAIILSTGLTTVGAAVAGRFFATQASMQGISAWFVIAQTTRSFDLVISALLLSALAASWWQYTQWTGAARGDEDESSRKRGGGQRP